MLEHRDVFQLATMCRVLEVARSGFYRWLHKPISDRKREDERLLELVRDSHEASDRTYGSPRIFLDLRELGERCGLNRIARIMQENKIRGISIPKKHPYVRGRASQVFTNQLNREFNPPRPNQSWVTDITYIRTWQGWLYLAVVIDLYSRKVVGWSMKPKLHREIGVLVMRAPRRPRL